MFGHVGGRSGPGAMLQPKFFLLGIELDDGRYMVMGSETMTEAQLRAEYEEGTEFIEGWMSYKEPDRLRCVKLTGNMTSYAYVVADSWAEAIRLMCKQWSTLEIEIPVAW